MVNAIKIALITGGAKRIGKSIAEALAKNGWKLVIHYNNSEKEAKELVDELEKITEIYSVKCDFTDIDQVKNLFTKINKEFGEVNLLINNASSFINDSYKSFKVERLETTLRTNFITPSILIRDFSNQKLFNTNNSGNIINVLDYCIFSAPTNFYSYTLSKMSLANLIQLNAKLLAPKIRINGIAIGYAMIGEKQNKKNFIKSISESPLGIPTSLEDILETINYILATKSLTGEIITIDSGKRFASNNY